MPATPASADTTQPKPGAEAVGEGVTRFRVGDEVMGRCDGAFAEYGVMNEAEVHPKPANLDWHQAASSTITYSTAHDTLMVQGHLQAGEWVLVTGVTSGVGVACLQLAKALGARVIGSSGSPDKLARLTSLGLDVPLLTRAAGIAQATLAATDQRGADVAVLSVGGSVLDECIQALGFQGRLGVVGYVDGDVHPKLDLLSLHKKRLHIYGVSNKMRNMSHRIAAAQALHHLIHLAFIGIGHRRHHIAAAVVTDIGEQAIGIENGTGVGRDRLILHGPGASIPG